MTDKKEDRGLLIRILSDRNIQLGFAFLTIALILAFVGAISELRTSTVSGDVGVEDKWDKIYYPYNAINSTLKLKYDSNGTNEEALIWFEDGYPYRNDSKVIGIRDPESGFVKENITLKDDESTKLDLENLERTPTTINFNFTEGSLEYNYTVNYANKPYGLLSLPAMFFLLLGMVFAFRGKGVILAEIKRKKMEEEQDEKGKRKEKKLAEEKTEEENVVYEGESGGGEADHIDFMGMSQEDEEEEK